MNSKPFRILHVRRKLFGARSVVLCDGSKTVLVAVSAAMCDGCSGSHCHRGILLEGEVTSERPSESIELKRLVDDFLHVL
jgi:hypothetical protein